MMLSRENLKGQSDAGNRFAMKCQTFLLHVQHPAVAAVSIAFLLFVNNAPLVEHNLKWEKRNNFCKFMGTFSPKITKT